MVQARVIYPTSFLSPGSELCTKIHTKNEKATAPRNCLPLSHCQKGRYVMRVPIIADRIMLRFIACLLSAALSGSFLFSDFFKTCIIHSFLYNFSHLFLWNLIYCVGIVVYKKSWNMKNLI